MYILNAPLLMPWLNTLQEARSLVELQAALDSLQRALSEVNHPIHAANGQSMSIDQQTFDAELAQISRSQTLERALYYVQRLRRSLTVTRHTRINDLNLNRWKEYSDIVTDSLWIEERRDRSGAHSADYWGNFIPQIPYQMMRRYTRKGDWVLDAFAGSGTTLIEARRLGRNVLGVELQEPVAARTSEIVATTPNPYHVTTEVVLGDCTTVDWTALLESHGRRTAHLALLHPPYFDIIKFSDDPRDLSNAPNVATFLHQLHGVAAKIANVLEPRRYLALVIGDIYTRGEWVPLGFQAMEAVQEAGFRLKSIVVKNIDATLGKRNQRGLWRYRALAGGFYVFKHEYVFVFQRR